MLDLRIATASFPVNGVTSEELISACEAALEISLKSGQSIVSADQIHKEAKLVDEIFPSKSPSGVPEKSKGNYRVNLGADEYLLTFPGFFNLADLPLVQEILSSFDEIENATLLEYSDGRLVFKLKSKINLSDKTFSEQLRNRLRSNWISRTKKEG